MTTTSHQGQDVAAKQHLHYAYSSIAEFYMKGFC
jgi:hypothetical protein